MHTTRTSLQDITTMSGSLGKRNESDDSKHQVGEDFVDVVEGKLSIENITSRATSPSAGAIGLFVGTTRNHFEGKEVLYLEYEAYLPMAKKKMLETCQLVRTQWNVENIVMVHRIGEVPVMETSIIIAISAAHRKEALEAVHFAIDNVKATVPIWKKEVYSDATSSWKENKECKWTSNN